jgi:HEPN domain-containing protein
MNSGHIEDYPQWHNYPLKLTNTEIANPHLVLEEFFTCYRLINLRTELWYVLTSIFERSVEVDRPGAIIFFLHQLEKLAEASSIIYQNQQKINTSMPVNKNDLKAIGTLLSDISEIEMIICFGYRLKHDGQWSCFPSFYPRQVTVKDQEIDLLILTKCEISKMKITLIINRMFPDIFPVITFQNPETFFHLVGYGNYFFSTVFQSGQILYSRTYVQGEKQESTATISAREIPEDTSKIFHRSQSFLDGAIFFQEKSNHNFCAFMCQQAVEQTLIKLIEMATGYRPHSHNIFELMEFTKNFTGDISVLLIESQAVKGVPAHLIRAYGDVRFNDNFSTSRIMADSILLLSTKIYQKAEELMEKIIASK